MILTGEEIRDKGIVKNDVEDSYRSVSYDLTVGVIVNSEGKEVENYTIPTQGVVKVVSAETIQMPVDKMGYVLVKTSLCNEGVLALNIGIVDPLWCGPLTSTLINFGKSSHPLRKGDVFSRLTIHDLHPKTPSAKAVTKSRSEAIRDSIRQVDNHLANTFLDIEATSEKAAKKAFEGYKAILFVYVPLAALVLAIFTFGLNFANMWGLYRYFYPQDMVRSSSLREDMEQQLVRVVRRNEELAERLAQMEKKVQRPPTRSGASK